MAQARTLNFTLTELRRLARAAQRRPSRVPDAAPLMTRLLASCRTVAIEQRVTGLAIRLQGGDAEVPAFSITCVLHDDQNTSLLTTAEQAVAAQLCEGRTLAQIAQLRGVTVNTVKSQVRQVFRKLDVDSRVSLVRLLCP
jgi:DNA-binding CsgD family transcriptional regulator